MKKLILPACLVLVGFMACKKKDEIHCDNAELRIKNTGNDTIYYGFNTSAWTEILLPDSTISHFVGPVEVTSTSESTVTTTFESDHGSFSIEINDCLITKEIQ